MEMRKAERRHLAANRSVQPEGKISYCLCLGGGERRRLESGERAREEKSMEEVTNSCLVFNS